MNSYYFFIVLLYFAFINSVIARFENFRSSSDKEAIKKLRNSVKNLITEEGYKYQLEDDYLFFWLRSKKFNLEETYKAFEQNLKWREDQRMSTIVSEPEMIKMRETLKLSYDESFDKKGHPAFQFIYGTWNLRRIVLAGKVNELTRYAQFNLENSIRAARAANVTQFNMLFSFNNFNLREQGCLLCLSFAAHYVRTYENHYPGQAHSIILINNPRSFEGMHIKYFLLLNFIKPFFSPDTENKIKIFGLEKNEWKGYIESIYSLDQLTSAFGGTKMSIKNPISN